MRLEGIEGVEGLDLDLLRLFWEGGEAKSRGEYWGLD